LALKHSPQKHWLQKIKYTFIWLCVMICFDNLLN
jgi:hypothetical protein